MILLMILRYHSIRSRHIRQRQEAEEERLLEQKRLENLAKSREAQDEMMQFRSANSSPRTEASEVHYRISGKKAPHQSSPDEAFSSLFQESGDGEKQ